MPLALPVPHPTKLSAVREGTEDGTEERKDYQAGLKYVHGHIPLPCRCRRIKRSVATKFRERETPDTPTSPRGSRIYGQITLQIVNDPSSDQDDPAASSDEEHQPDGQ
jgi:hypothetical protein